MSREVANRRLLMTVDAVGGVWTYALDLAAGLRAHGWTTVLAVLGPPPSPSQRAAATAAGLRVVPTDAPLDWLAADAAAVRAAAATIAVLAAGERVDLVHLNAPALAAIAYSAPVVVGIHSCVATWWAAVRGGPLPAEFAWQTALVAQGLAAADAVIAPSHAFATTITARYGVRPVVVHNGRATVPGPASAPRNPAAEVPGVPAPAPAVFTAGRLWDAGKDIATLDRVAARLDVPFTAAGPLAGPHSERVAFAHLTTPGALPPAAIAAHLAARPVFASTAVYEPFGLAVVEAAAAGCALVLADTPTFRELWDGAATFVPARDDAGFAAAISALIADPARRSAAGDAARARAARFSVAAMARATDGVYARVLGACEAAAA